MENTARSRADVMFRYDLGIGSEPAGFSLVTDRFVCLMQAGASHEKLLALWEILDGNSSGFEDILTYFARDGIAALPSFALAQLVDTATGSVLLAVRGEGRIELDGPGSTSYVGAGATTWVEGSAQQVTGMTVSLGAQTEDARTLPLLRGIVSSTRVVWGSALALSSSDQSDPSETTGGYEDLSELTDLPDWARPTGPNEDLDSPPELSGDIQRRGSVQIGSAQIGSVQIADDDEKTVYVRGNRSRSVSDSADDAEKTVMLASRKNRNVPKAQSPRLALPDGSTAELDAPIIIGRKPRAEAGAGVVARLVTVTSPTNEVSASHIEFSSDDGVVRVRDLNSTNGSIIRSPGREAFVLSSGETITASQGTDVDIGDGNIVTVVH